MYIYHALVNALSARIIHVNLNTICYTHVDKRDMQRAVQFLEKTYTLIQLIAHSNAKMRNNVYLNCSESHMLEW